MPKVITKQLNMEESESYTVHTFQRTSITLLTDYGADIMTLKRLGHLGGWKSSSIAE